MFAHLSVKKSCILLAPVAFCLLDMVIVYLARSLPIRRQMAAHNSFPEAGDTLKSTLVLMS